jgi:hypothetical protein
MAPRGHLEAQRMQLWHASDHIGRGWLPPRSLTALRVQATSQAPQESQFESENRSWDRMKRTATR